MNKGKLMKSSLRIFAKMLVTSALAIGLSQTAVANPFYCPQNSQYINTGMSEGDVRQACGAPQAILKSKKKGVQRVPVTQLTFTVSTQTVGQMGGTITPGVQSGAFQVNTGPLATVVVNVTNDVISSIMLNGNASESLSVCPGGSFGVGDPGSNAVDSCGNPSAVNDTYKNVPTDQTILVDTWSYNPGNYQKPFKLTFTDGVLTAING